MNLSDLQHAMFRIRLVEEAIANRYGEEKMRCPVHLAIGQEAIAVGVCKNLTNEDLVLSSHRAHAHFLAKGGSLRSMIAEIYGKVTGCSKGMGGSMHLIDKSVGFMGSTAIVGNTIPVAVGLALAFKIKRSPSISCAFFGDGAVEEGAFYESVNFAVLHKLPMLFICENNLYSVYSGLDVRQPNSRKIYEMVAGMGIETNHGNGNCILEVGEKVREAKEKIVSGKGPQFLEFDTYRWREHCGPNYDNDIGYRSEQEFKEWQKRDPLREMFDSYSEQGLEDITKKISLEIDDAFAFAEESKFPQESDLYQAFHLS
jgi:TPP-dependent pyruvate/acetoin dehydrogenase alpha subunit